MLIVDIINFLKNRIGKFTTSLIALFKKNTSKSKEFTQDIKVEKVEKNIRE